MKKKLFAFVAIIFLPLLMLQGGTGRQDRLLGQEYFDSVHSRGMFVARTAGASILTVSIIHPASSQQTSTDQIALDLPLAGAVEAVTAGPQAAVSTFVVCGRNSAGKGVLYLVREGATGFGLSGSAYTETGSDFCGLSYSASTGRLYVFDAGKNRIIWADLSPSATILPTSWQVGLSGGSMPVVSDPGDYQIGMMLDGAEPELRMTRLLPGVGPGPEDSYRIIHKQSGFALETVVGRAGRAGSIASLGIVAEDPNLLVELRGPATSQIKIESLLTGQVFATTVTDQSGSATTSVLMAFQLGDVVGARTFGWPELNAPFYAPYRSWGSPDALTLGVMEPLGPYLGVPSYLGNVDYQVGLDVEVGNPSQFAGNRNAWLAVGTEGDIQSLGSGRYLLNSPVVYGLSVLIDNEYPRAAVYKELPIPNDPSLTGSTVCYQWWIEDTGGIIKLGNIAQVMIRGGAAGMPALLSTAPGPRKKVALPAKKRRRVNALAVDSWLSRISGRLAPAKRLITVNNILRRGR